jgi:hypothetical protein
MDAHPRITIRKSAVAALIAKKTVCGERVFKNRPLPGFSEEYPYIHVYITDETSDHNDTAPREHTRKPIMHAEIVCAAYQKDPETNQETRINKDLDDEMDAIAADVEQVLLTCGYIPDPDTGLESVDVKMVGTTQKLFDAGTTVEGSTDIRFELTYITDLSVNAEDVGDPFETGIVKIDSNSDGVVELVANAEIPQEGV